MRFRRRNLLSATTIWLTACTTLFATSPHFECLCPDGSRKPTCLSFFFGADHCWSNPSKPAAEPTCCCCQAKPSTVEVKAALRNASGEPSVSSPACGKELSQTVACTEDSAPRTTPFDDASPDLFADASILTFVQQSDIPNESPSPPISRPPLDLTILHQHFCI